jgi:HEPN domain-containing protein
MSNETKQTAVEWLLFELSKNGLLPDGIPIDIHQQAKAMEKEQIIDAYWDGGQDVPLHINTCEQYYNETYGGNK